MVRIKLISGWMAHRPGTVIDVSGVEADLLCERGTAVRVNESKAHSAPPENKAHQGPPERKALRRNK